MKRKKSVEKRVEVDVSMVESRMCSETAESFGEVPLCWKCHRRRKGTWIDMASNFWGTWAVVCLDDGSVEKFPLDRIKVIKEDGDGRSCKENDKAGND